MEKDNEIKPGAGTSDGNSYTAEFRLYDPRLGRWLTLDPVFKPWESQYAAFANDPVLIVDPSGLDGQNSNVGKLQPPHDVEGQIERKAAAKIKQLKVLIEGHKKVQAEYKKQMDALQKEISTLRGQWSKLVFPLDGTNHTWKEIEVVEKKIRSLELKLDVVTDKYKTVRTKVWDYQNQLTFVYAIVPIKTNEPIGDGTEQKDLEGFTQGSENPVVSDEDWGSHSGDSPEPEKKRDGVYKEPVGKPVFKKGYGDSSTDYYEVHHITRIVKKGVEQTYDTIYFYNTKTKKFLDKDRVYYH